MGSGKFRTAEEMRDAYAAAEAEIVTVAIRRLDLDNPSQKTLLDEIDWTRYTVLPNTAGCYTVDEAVRCARLGRELTGSNWVKLEVIGDPKYLWPDPVGTLEAARLLVKDGFVVLPYTTDDPILAKRLEEAGCATVMPMGSPIGSGQGIPYFGRIRVIIEQASVPVVVDAGLGVPSDEHSWRGASSRRRTPARRARWRASFGERGAAGPAPAGRDAGDGSAVLR